MLTSISLSTLAQTSTDNITGVVRDGATGETMPKVNVVVEGTLTGAFGSENWTSGWCNWNPQNTAC